MTLALNSTTAISTSKNL